MSPVFELLQGATVYTRLHIRNAYHLVHIKDKDEWKTAFNTPTGHYKYLIMLFRKTNTPAVFQTLINNVLCDMLNHFAYLDDILIFSNSLHEYVRHVWQVLQYLLRNHLYVKLEMCEFHSTEISFLGFIVSKDSLQMDPKKTKAVRDWPTLCSVKEVQHFLGFANIPVVQPQFQLCSGSSHGPD